MKSIPAIIKEGKIEFNPKSLLIFTQGNDGKECELSLKEKSRSLSQLGMYRAWLTRVAEQTGNDTEELHEFLLDKCAPRKILTIRGRKGEVHIEKYKRTSGGSDLSMDHVEMSEYLDKVALLTGYPLPTREELEAMGYILNY